MKQLVFKDRFMLAKGMNSWGLRASGFGWLAFLQG